MTAWLSRSTVSCSRRMVAVGLKATRSTIGSPLLMPPWIAAGAVGRGARAPVGARHEGVVVLDAGQARAGEAAADLEALRRGQREQRPARGRPRACRRPARRGPGGTPRTTHSTTPPSESPRRRAASMRLLHARRGVGVGAAHEVRLDLRERHALGVHLRVEVVDAARPRRAPRRPRPPRAASARSRRPRRGRSSRARSRARRPASCGCRTSPRWCSRRARGGRRPSSPRRPRAARPRCGRAARSGCRASGPRRRPRGSRRGRPPGAAW